MGKSIICIVTGSSNSREKSSPPSFVSATLSLSLTLSPNHPRIRSGQSFDHICRFPPFFVRINFISFHIVLV